MKRFTVTGYATIEIVTVVEANSEEEAEQIAQDRELMICGHGTFEGDQEKETDWVYNHSFDAIEVDLAEEE